MHIDIHIHSFPKWLRSKDSTQPLLQKAQVWSLGQEDPLEEGMATHSSILAWRIPWLEEPGGQQSIASQRVVHDWSDFARMHTCTYDWFELYGRSQHNTKVMILQLKIKYTHTYTLQNLYRENAMETCTGLSLTFAKHPSSVWLLLRNTKGYTRLCKKLLENA